MTNIKTTKYAATGKSGGMFVRAVEICRYRRTLLTLAKKEIKTKYKESLLGYLWSLLDPIFNMLILVVVYQYLFRVKVENYPLYIITGIIPWSYFQGSVMRATNGLKSNQGLIKQIYFPKEITIFQPVLSNLVHFLLSFIAIIPFMAYYKVAPSWGILFLPGVILCQTFLATGLGLAFSILNVYFKDVELFLGHFLRIWFFASPILYPLHYIEEIDINVFGIDILKLYMLNPTSVMAYLYRWCLYDFSPVSLKYVFVMISLSVACFILGFWYFGKHEPNASKRL